VLSIPMQSPPATSTGDRLCPECGASWEVEVTQAAAWLGAGSRLEGYCGCGSFLVWEHLRGGGWALASWVPPAASDQ
jgi:hypothetical protein